MSDGATPPLGRDEFERLVAGNALFSTLTPAQLDAVYGAVTKVVRLGKGEKLIEEGAPPGELYLVRSGRFDISKREQDGSTSHSVAAIGPGMSVGEVALLDRGPRSASVVAAEDAEVVVIDVDALSAHAELDAGAQMKINLGVQLAARLRHANETTISHLMARLAEEQLSAEMGKFISRMLFGISLYVFGLGLTSALSSVVPDSSVITVPISMVLAFFFYRTIKTSPYPVSTYGITLKDWKRKSLEALAWSIPLLVAIVAAKAWMVGNVPSMQGRAVFDFGRTTGLSMGSLVTYAALYCAFTPVQELCTRGGIQTSLEMFIKGRHAALQAIILSNLMFSLTHLHLSLVTAAIVFPVGLFWGWLYWKQRSLVGVSVSHAFVGVTSLFIIGFDGLF